MARNRNKLKLAPAETPNAPDIDAAREYVSAPGLQFASRGQVIPTTHHSEECLPDDVYRRMAHDPEVSANLWLLVNRVLADGVTLHPVEFPTDEAKTKTANDVRDFLKACLDDLPKPFVETLEGLLYKALQYGHKIAEQTYKPLTAGPNSGKIGLASIKLKARAAVNFVVDSYWNVVGFQARYADAGQAILPRAKFVVLTLRGEDEDPRGRSWLRAAVNGWSFKTQSVWPNYHQLLERFGVPSVVGKTAPGAKDQVLKDSNGTILTDANGRPRTITPQDQMLLALLGLKNNQAIAIPDGADVTALGIATDAHGQAFSQSLTDTNGEITRGMLFQTRATNEAQHGSKADSQTGSEILDWLIWNLKGKVSAVIAQDILKPLLIMNYGEESLDMMPAVSLGDSDRKDWAKDATAATLLFPHLTKSQKLKVQAQIGIDPPEEGEDMPDPSKMPPAASNSESGPSNNPAQGQNQPPSDPKQKEQPK